MDRIERALAAVPRNNFLPDSIKDMAGCDSALPIGFGQTNSQPSTVQLMLEWLQVVPGSKILDVGSGSGWTTALLAHLTGPKGIVHAVEIVPKLVDFGRQNVRRLGITNAKFHQAGSGYGLPRLAPFERILVSAAAGRLPQELIEQLSPGGKMVIPVGNEMLEIDKLPNGQVEINKHPDYMFFFVPLLESNTHT